MTAVWEDELMSACQLFDGMTHPLKRDSGVIQPWPTVQNHEPPASTSVFWSIMSQFAVVILTELLREKSNWNKWEINLRTYILLPGVWSESRPNTPEYTYVRRVLGVKRSCTIKRHLQCTSSFILLSNMWVLKNAWSVIHEMTKESKHSRSSTSSFTVQDCCYIINGRLFLPLHDENKLYPSC